MRVITLFEYQTKTLHELSLSSNDPTLSQLEQINQLQGVELIHVGRYGLTAQQYVGVLRLDEVTFQILPKIDCLGDTESRIDSPQQAQAIDSATQNLLYLLSYTHDIRLYQQHLASLRSQPADWFELLTRLFAEELHLQIKHGLDQSYVHIEERRSTLRGTWQIQKQITRPPYERHLFDIAYDEFLPDTTLNRVFRLAVDRLLRITQDKNNKRLLTDIAAWMIQVPLVPRITTQQLDRIQFTRLNARFRTAFNLARLFLESLAPQLIAEKKQSFAFVLDMNVLFERFVFNFLQRHHQQIFRVPFDNLRIIAQAKGMPFYLAERMPEGQKVFHLKPDILLVTPDNTVIAIIDTKYKQLSPEQEKIGIAEADFYQMLAYSIKLGCTRAMLLYPTSAGNNHVGADFRVQGQEIIVRATTIDLHRPLDHPEYLIEQLRYSMSALLRERIYDGLQS